MSRASNVHVQNSIIIINCSLVDLSLSLDKSKLQLMQQITLIRADLDAATAIAYLPIDRFQSIVTLSELLKSNPTTTVHSCLQLLGHMALCMYRILHIRLHLCHLQAWLHLVFQSSKHSLDMLTCVPAAVFQSLDWWLDPGKCAKRHITRMDYDG